MTIVFPILQFFSFVACLPAYRVAKQRQEEPVWALFLVAPCMILWIVLTMLGIGAQSMSNLVELFDLMLGTVMLYYAKVFIFDKINQTPVKNNLLVIAVTLVAAVLLRLFMPVLPE